MGDGGLCDNERTNGDDDNFMNWNQPSNSVYHTARLNGEATTIDWNGRKFNWKSSRAKSNAINATP